MSRKFYIIGVSYNIEGLFAIVNSVMNHVMYAEKMGYIPIVDMKHYKNQYFRDNKAFRENAWEYFFEQPAGYTLDDINEDDEVIISKNEYYVDKESLIWVHELPVNSFKSDLQKVENYKSENRLRLKFNKDILNDLEKNYSDLCNNDNVLGVLCRGTDYLKKKPKGEEKQPGFLTVINKAKKVLKKYPNIKKVYLATEDDEIYKAFKNEFGDMLIDNKQYRYEFSGLKDDFISNIKVERKNHTYELAKEYLRSIYILSKCKYFIGGRTTGTKWAWIFAENWEYCYIWKLGKYGKSVLDHLFSVSSVESFNKKYKVYSLLGIKLKIRLN